MVKQGGSLLLLIRAVMLALFVLGCYIAAKAVMLWMDPSSEWVAPQAQASESNSSPVSSNENFDLSFDPFFRDQPIEDIVFEEVNPNEDAPDTTLNLTLKGFVAPRRATIQGADRTQKSYGVGDEISSGVTLEGIYPEGEYVILSRDGNRERLSIERTSEIQSAPRAPVNVNVSSLANGTNPLELLNAIQFEPVNSGDSLTGYKIAKAPGVDLKKLGFRDGDVLTRVGTQDLTNPDVNVQQAILQAALSGKSTAQILRRGRKMTIRVKLP